jgi:hypothetical protein
VKGKMGAVTSMDEEYLLRRVARGDLGAFDELYRRTSPWLAVRLRRRCADDELVGAGDGPTERGYSAIMRRHREGNG